MMGTELFKRLAFIVMFIATLTMLTMYLNPVEGIFEESVSVLRAILSGDVSAILPDGSAGKSKEVPGVSVENPNERALRTPDLKILKLLEAPNEIVLAITDTTTGDTYNIPLTACSVVQSKEAGLPKILISLQEGIPTQATFYTFTNPTDEGYFALALLRADDADAEQVRTYFDKRIM